MVWETPAMNVRWTQTMILTETVSVVTWTTVPTPISQTVIIDGCGSEVSNTLLPTGCTISDKIAECTFGAKNHGEFVSCVSHPTNDLKKDGTIAGQQKGAIQTCAAQANVP